MTAADLDQLSAHDKAVIDDYTRRRFGVEPAEDRSGLFGGHPTPGPGETDEEALFQAHLRYFPGV
jgi:hypothetical protein